MLIVHKRDNTTVPFDKQKIINAINGALIEVDGKLYEEDTARDIAIDIEKSLANQTDVSIEELQNLVEEFLMRSERLDVARAYVRFRYKKEVARNYEHDFIDAIREKLNADNIQKHIFEFIHIFISYINPTV